MLYDPLEQGSANCAHRAPEALTCCLWVLHTLQAEVSACDWEHTTFNTEYMYCLALHQKVFQSCLSYFDSR